MEDFHIIGKEVWIFSWYPSYEKNPQARIQIYHSERAAKAIQTQYTRIGGYSTHIQSTRVKGHPTNEMGREI